MLLDVSSWYQLAHTLLKRTVLWIARLVLCQMLLQDLAGNACFHVGIVLLCWHTALFSAVVRSMTYKKVPDTKLYLPAAATAVVPSTPLPCGYGLLQHCLQLQLQLLLHTAHLYSYQMLALQWTACRSMARIATVHTYRMQQQQHSHRCAMACLSLCLAFFLLIEAHSS